MIIGSVVLATDQGLGYLAKSFVEQGVIDEVFVWRHSRRANHYEWYPKRCESIDQLMQRVDILLGFETFFDTSVVSLARQYNVKLVLVPMYECSAPVFVRSSDLIINPSDLDQRYYQQGTRLNIPVDIPWERREKARVFVHNAGNGGLMGRNGTRELLEAMQFVTSPITLKLRFQEGEYKTTDSRIVIERGTIPEEELYTGDVFVFPEKFNGLSLPLQEAFASGMGVMATKRYPMDRWLPNELLIDSVGSHEERTFFSFPVSDISPKKIALKIDEWYDKDITRFSELGLRFAINNSWGKLKPQWLEVLQTQM